MQQHPFRRWELTAVEAAADSSNYYLERKETAHAVEDVAALLVNGMNADHVHEGAGGEENCGADGLEEEEVGTLLCRGSVKMAGVGREHSDGEVPTETGLR